MKLRRFQNTARSVWSMQEMPAKLISKEAKKDKLLAEAMRFFGHILHGNLLPHSTALQTCFLGDLEVAFARSKVLAIRDVSPKKLVAILSIIAIQIKAHT